MTLGRLNSSYERGSATGCHVRSMKACPGLICWAGLLALIASYFQTSSSLSLSWDCRDCWFSWLGWWCSCRRRGYRRLRAQYDAPDALDEVTAVSDHPQRLPEAD